MCERGPWRGSLCSGSSVGGRVWGRLLRGRSGLPLCPPGKESGEYCFSWRWCLLLTQPCAVVIFLTSWVLFWFILSSFKILSFLLFFQTFYCSIAFYSIVFLLCNKVHRLHVCMYFFFLRFPSGLGTRKTLSSAPWVIQQVPNNCLFIQSIRGVHMSVPPPIHPSPSFLRAPFLASVPLFFTSESLFSALQVGFICTIFPRFYIYEQYCVIFVFSFWLTSLCVTVSRSSRLSGQFYSFSQLSYIPLDVCTVSSFCSFLCWWTCRLLPCSGSCK